MASPLSTGKKPVNLLPQGAPGSRIRRDPPPPVKQVVVRDIEEHDRRNAVVGIIVFALSLVVILVGFSSISGCTISEYTLRLDAKDM